MKLSVIVGVGVAVGAVLFHFSLLRLAVITALYLTVCALGVWWGMSWTLVRGKTYCPPPAVKDVSAVNKLLKSLMESKANAIPDQRKVVISRSMDLAIQEVLDLIQRDFILSWYSELGKDEKNFTTLIQNETWLVIEELSKRLSNIDWVKFITQSVVSTLYAHFRDIRFAARRTKEVESQPKFILHPCMESEDSQTEFVRKICDVLLVILLPTRYSTLPSARHLLREILTLSDYINQKLLDYLEYREKLSEDTRKTYTYAATYEDFMKMIEKCEDIEHLKQIRFNIITEIMQATTISNLKRAKGIDTGKATSPKGTAKGDLLKARNLKRYINQPALWWEETRQSPEETLDHLQLTVAKSRCEKLIHSLGGPDYKYYTENADVEGVFPGQKVQSFSVIMETPAARESFLKYLRKDDSEPLLRFWIGVENLKAADKKTRHQLANDLYQRFIAGPTSTVKNDIKANLKAMEAFLLGNGGPDAFYLAQAQVYHILEEKFYASFIVSDIYHRYISTVEEDTWDSDTTSNKDELSADLHQGEGELSDDATAIVSQSFHAQQLLEQLSEKISNKMHALQALKSSQKADDKILKLREDMERELENLKLERRQLEFHIERTDVWCENVGQWRATIHTAEIVQEGDKVIPYFTLLVHLPGDAVPPTQNTRPASHGWVVSHSLSDFHNLHVKLMQIGSWLRKRELPTVNWFRSVDSAFLEKAKAAIQDFLVAVLKDDRMVQSEALYAFLTPTPEYLKQALPEKKSKFFLANLFKSTSTARDTEGDGYGDLMFAGDDSSKEDRSKDSIAEPLYGLIREVFELSGMFKWLRKSFIVFVEVTFGRSINRQLRETVDWILSESMLIYYMRLFRESMWPEGELVGPLPARTDEEKLQTRLQSKQKLLNSIPDAVKSLVGDTNARQGTIKMFEVLQDSRLNKHLVYILLQQFLEELCPELTQNQGETTQQADSVAAS